MLELAEVTSAELEILTAAPPIFLPSYSAYVIKSNAIGECAKELVTSFGGVLSNADREVQKKKPEIKVSIKL